MIGSAEHVRMMRTPADWPHWPLLPLKRWRGRVMETAVLLATEPVMVIFDANMFMLTEHDEARAVSADPQRLVSDGWGVD